MRKQWGKILAAVALLAMLAGCAGTGGQTACAYPAPHASNC
jgi:hypothetical protein